MRLNLALAVVSLVACSTSPAPALPAPPVPLPQAPPAQAARWCYEALGTPFPWNCSAAGFTRGVRGPARTREACIADRDAMMHAGGRTFGPCERAPAPHCFSWQGDYPGTFCAPTLAACDSQRDHDVRSGTSPMLTPCDPMQ